MGLSHKASETHFCKMYLMWVRAKVHSRGPKPISLPTHSKPISHTTSVTCIPQKPILRIYIPIWKLKLQTGPKTDVKQFRIWYLISEILVSQNLAYWNNFLDIWKYLCWVSHLCYFDRASVIEPVQKSQCQHRASFTYASNTRFATHPSHTYSTQNAYHTSIWSKWVWDGFCQKSENPSQTHFAICMWNAKC